MKSNDVGVATSHNAPSILTVGEKRLRAKLRALTHELEFQQKRALRFEAESTNASNPVHRASAGAELELARQRVGECAVALAELQMGAVN